MWKFAICDTDIEYQSTNHNGAVEHAKRRAFKYKRNLGTLVSGKQCSGDKHLFQINQVRHFVTIHYFKVNSWYTANLDITITVHNRSMFLPKSGNFETDLLVRLFIYIKKTWCCIILLQIFKHISNVVVRTKPFKGR